MLELRGVVRGRRKHVGPDEAVFSWEISSVFGCVGFGEQGARDGRNSQVSEVGSRGHKGACRSQLEHKGWHALRDRRYLRDSEALWRASG